MNHSGWVDPRIDRVRVEDVRTYLCDHGWRLQPFPGPELLVFVGPADDDGQPILQVLPASERLLDYRMRLEDLLGALSVLEDRPAGDILTDMLRTTAQNGTVDQSARDGSNASVRGV